MPYPLPAAYRCVRQCVSKVSLMGVPVNWISCPAPATTAREAPIRSARSSHMASNPALCPPDTTSLGNDAAASSSSGRWGCQNGRPRRSTGTSGSAAARKSGGNSSGSLPTALRKPMTHCSSEMSCRLGDPLKAETFARNGLARAAASAAGRWRCLHPLSTALMMRGDHEGAPRCSRDAAAEPDCPPTVRAYLEANVGLARSYAGTADPSDNDRPTADLIHGDWPTGRAWGWYVAAEAVRLTDPWESLRRLDRAVDEARRVESVFIQGLAEVGMVAAALRVGDHATALRLFPEAIRGWQRSGSWLQQWTTLRTLATLLTELGAHEQAAVLVGAIDTAPEAPAVAGAEATAHAALRRRLEARLGTVPFARQTARGAAQPRTAVVEYALRVIDAVSPTVPAAGDDPASAEISTWAPTAG
jgi:hypothetical protein